MIEHLEEQLVNELRSKLQELNDKYKDFYHFQILTIVELGENEKCNDCTTNEVQPKCLRCVVGVKDHTKCETWE